MKFHSVLLCFLVSLSVGSVKAANPEQNLADLMSPAAKISANFSQKLFDADGFEMDSSSGLFSVARPKQILWHTTEPLEQKVVSNGKVVWIYDPDLAQVIIEPAERILSGSPIALFSGNLSDIQRHYAVAEEYRANTAVFSLVPTSKTSLFKEITIVFVDGVPDSITLTDTLRQKTKIQFGNVNLNPALDDAAFDFVVPADVDVINNVR